MLLPPNLSASCVQHLLLDCEAANVLGVFVIALPVLGVLHHSALLFGSETLKETAIDLL